MIAPPYVQIEDFDHTTQLISYHTKREYIRNETQNSLKWRQNYRNFRQVCSLKGVVLKVSNIIHFEPV